MSTDLARLARSLDMAAELMRSAPPQRLSLDESALFGPGFDPEKFDRAAAAAQEALRAAIAACDQAVLACSRMMDCGADAVEKIDAARRAGGGSR